MADDKEILKAIDLVKKSLKPLKKTKTSADGAYKYVTLDDVMEILKKTLPKYKLGFVQFLEEKDGNNCLKTIVFHESGQNVTSSALIPDIKYDFLSTMQSVGSNITYMRRYALCTIFGICSEDDTDGQSTVPGYSQKDKDLIQERCKQLQLSAESVKKVKDMINSNLKTEVILRNIKAMK